jgi:peptidoglycan biosynthesis protein MviN/MurJ (putative lipid II flippase)
LVLVLDQSRYAIRVNFVCLILSVPISVAGAHFFGLAGAALGSTVTAYVELLALLRRAAIVSNGSFGKVQSWRTLWRLLGCAVAAASAAFAFSWAMTSGAFNGLLQIGFAALVCATAYLAMTAYLRLLPGVSARRF